MVTPEITAKTTANGDSMFKTQERFLKGRIGQNMHPKRQKKKSCIVQFPLYCVRFAVSRVVFNFLQALIF
jgi:hypothetical protein